MQVFVLKMFGAARTTDSKLIQSWRLWGKRKCRGGHTSSERNYSLPPVPEKLATVSAFLKAGGNELKIDNVTSQGRVEHYNNELIIILVIDVLVYFESKLSHSPMRYVLGDDHTRARARDHLKIRLIASALGSSNEEESSH